MIMNNEILVRDNTRLGKMMAKSSQKALLFEDFLKKTVETPEAFDFWGKRAKFPLRSFGNTQHGCCTIASQAIGAMRMERLEQRRTIEISTDEVLKTYYALTGRLYGGGDTGAYETDALSNWRKADLSFKDQKGRALTIDAFTRVNHFDHQAVKTALYVTAGKGIKVCFALPEFWSDAMDQGKAWDAPPPGEQLIGRYMPNSWGGHSMYAVTRYNKDGFWVVHTWNRPDQFVTWAGAALYMDEVHWVVDSVNWWKKTKATSAINFSKLVSHVNQVSAEKIHGA